MKQLLVLLLSTLCWGLWGFASKMASDRSPSFAVLMAYSIPWAISLPIFYYVSFKSDGMGMASGLLWGIGSGISAIIGMFAFVVALRWGASSFGIMMVSVYPLITLFLLILTGQEHLTIYQGIGALLIIAGLFVLQI